MKSEKVSLIFFLLWIAVHPEGCVANHGGLKYVVIYYTVLPHCGLSGIKA